MEADDPLQLFSELSAEGMRQFGCSAYGKQDIKGTLERAGFTQVQVVVQKIPISTWPRDKKMRMLGMFMKTIIMESLGAYAAKPLAALDIPSTERDALVVRVRKSLEDNRIHRYINCSFYYAQKEELVSDSESYFE